MSKKLEFTNEVLKLVAVNSLIEKHNLEIAQLLKDAMQDWKEDPIIYAQLEAEYNKYKTAAETAGRIAFHIVKHTV
jgi:hypothetical protein